MAQTWLPIFVTVRCWSRRHSLISDNLPVPLRRVSCGRWYRGPNPRSVKFPLPRWPVAANYNWARTYKNGLEPILPVFRRHGPERLKACVMPVGVWCGRGVHSGPKLPTVAAGRDCLTSGPPLPSDRRGSSGSATGRAAPAPARLPPPVFPRRSDRLSLRGRSPRPSRRFRCRAARAGTGRGGSALMQHARLCRWSRRYAAPNINKPVTNTPQSC